MNAILKNLLMQAVIDCLNTAAKDDPGAIHALVCNTIPCNQALADHPHVVVGTSPATKTTQVGAIGLLNGVLTSIGLDRIAHKWEDDPVEKYPDGKPRQRFVGFVVAGPESQPQTEPLDPITPALEEERQKIDALVEASKNDNTILVGSDIRWLAGIIRRQEETIAQLMAMGSTLAQVVDDTAKELGCKNDNEEILKTIARNMPRWYSAEDKPKFAEGPGAGAGWSVWVVGYDQHQKNDDGPNLRIVSWSHEMNCWHNLDNTRSRVTHWRYFTVAERELIK